MSRIGNTPISLPEKVTINVGDDSSVTVEGPKGKLEWTLPPGIELNEEDGTIKLACTDSSRKTRALFGTSRALISNMVTGVSEGFSRRLDILGVGFRASIKGDKLDLSLGYSHPLLHPIPSDLTVTVEENTKILVQGIDKQRVGQFAADVRAYYPPEPYKGKGVRYSDEHVRRKAGKSVQK
jgi:large subunit ribosomal protein L6